MLSIELRTMAHAARAMADAPPTEQRAFLAGMAENLDLAASTAELEENCRAGAIVVDAANRVLRRHRLMNFLSGRAST